MGLIRVSKDEKGIALFMVLAAVAVLALLVTEFTYVAQVNQKMAADGLDQIRAFYLAKSAYKLSLLRLKAYYQVRSLVSGMAGAGAGSMVPKQAIEQIWSFPIFYPIPSNIPGLTPGQKAQIEKFQKESSLPGNFTSNIESESSKYNLNMILSSFVPEVKASPSPSPSGSPNPNPSPSPTGGVAQQKPFDAVTARQSLADFLGQILESKYRQDPDFAGEYRDFRLEDFMENLIAWADRTYEPRSTGGREAIRPKRAPFYSVSEMHMIYPLNDELYELFAPSLTVSTTPGININTVNEATLRALVPQILDEEVKEFFEFRDSMDADNYFKTDTAFFDYLKAKVTAFNGDEGQVQKFRESLTKKNIRIVTEETQFKITVMGQVNQATQIIEAWVTLTGAGSNSPLANVLGANPQTGASPVPGQPPNGAIPPVPGAPVPMGDTPPKPDPGLKVTFMRIL